MRAINDARKKLLLRGDLKRALTERDHAAALEAAGKAVDVLIERMQPGLEAVLHEVLSKAGEIATTQLKRRVRSQRAAAGFRTADVVNFNFEDTNPGVIEWVKGHAGETISNISEDTRAQIRDVIEEAFADQFDVDDLADEIADLIGDADRAEVIARTEVQRASNQGQLEAWDQATDAGLLTGNEQKEWIVTPDDRLCPVCEPMDGQNVGLNEDFDVDGDRIDGPPAHPNCRCTLGLTLN